MKDPRLRFPTYSSYAGKLIRLPLRLIPVSLPVPMLQPGLWGLRWLPGAGVHSYWLGIYEIAKRRRFEREVRSGDTVFDIGANVGYYTLISSRIVGIPGQVVACEPLPRNVRYLQHHLKINHISNVHVLDVAVGKREGTVCFNTGITTSEGFVSDTGDIQVRCSTIDSIVNEGGVRPPDVLKIDVEGAELEALQGSVRTLHTHRPRIFLATHSPELRDSCLRFLESLDYTWEPLCGDLDANCDEFFAR